MFGCGAGAALCVSLFAFFIYQTRSSPGYPGSGLAPKEAERRFIINSLASQWEGDPTGNPVYDALSAVLRIDDSKEREYKMKEIVTSMDLKEVALAMRLLDTVELANNGLPLLVRWLELDHRSAVAHINSTTSRLEADLILYRALEEWSKDDPWAAYNCILENESILFPSTGTGVIRAVINTWYQSDKTGALEAVLNLPNERGLQEAAMTDLAYYLYPFDRNEGAGLLQLLSSVANDPYRLELVANGWSERQPAAAADLFWTLDHTERRSKHMEVIFERWKSQNVSAAADWLADKVPHRDLDPAVRGVVLETLSQNPVEAFYWAQSVEDITERETLTLLVGRQWMKQEPQLARSVIEQSSISPGVKSTLLPNQNLRRYEAASSAGQVIAVPAGESVQIIAPVEGVQYRIVESDPDRPLTEEEQRLIEQAVDEALITQGQ